MRGAGRVMGGAGHGPAACLLVCLLPIAGLAQGIFRSIILPEQRTIEVRDPASLPRAALPPIAPPRTVSDSQGPLEPWHLSLDEAIRIALVNTRVVRVLTGISAQASGSTIYDPAITNTTIDQQRAGFDPILEQRTSVNRAETPQLGLNPASPTEVIVNGLRTDEVRSETGVNKTNLLGGRWDLRWTERVQSFNGQDNLVAPTQNPSTVELGYTQPLLQGGGFLVNTAPIVVARINTERSFFQYKDSVQELVRGVIDAYWNLVQARTDAWARRMQFKTAEEAYQREKARQEIAGLASLRDVAQARVTYNQFRANLTAAEANILDREAALRNLLFLPPVDQREIIPVSLPTNQRLPRDWSRLLGLAEQFRPDIIELKLILEVDRMQLIQARNQALPRLDAFALYRWNGLNGELANGVGIASDGGQFTDWSVGVNFSVPLGLRQGRASVRQQELIVARDRENLLQGLHATAHDLALTARELDSAYEQYLAFQETRKAAYENLLVQLAEFRVHRVIYLNVLQALNDWGNALTSEAQTLMRYNVALATLERKTGTILETHGLVFAEERFRTAGPLGVFGQGRWYPAALPPGGAPARYPANEKQEPSEHYFDLRNPADRIRPGDEVLPRPRPVPGGQPPR